MGSVIPMKRPATDTPLVWAGSKGRHRLMLRDVVVARVTRQRGGTWVSDSGNVYAGLGFAMCGELQKALGR